MTLCLVYDLTTKESETFFSLNGAKKWMRERQKQGHEYTCIYVDLVTKQQ